MKKLTFGEVLADNNTGDDYYRAEDVRWLLRELTYVSRETGQLLTVKADVTDLVGPIIGVTRS